ncbi:berberine bridge enzyme-like 21 [Impatiens glandulifera]|uniref:berberine bridge enzyme-like 21 n=1 Tax=Impatiens glandulifera TaxID=253017 RepID=UPI001FB107F1|nr:berberine bridge enzyme-like 21 [Impatiens glandulifera]
MSVLSLLLFSLFLSPFLSSPATVSGASSDYETFINCLSGSVKNAGSIVYIPQNPSYSTVLQSYIRNLRFNTSTTSKPSIIVTPKTESHVSAAILCSKKTKLIVKIRSGGHDYDGLSYISNSPFLILDMFNLRSVSVNPKTQTAWVQAGATLGEVYYRIAAVSNTLGFPAGVCPTVGVGGHISGGGYGTMLRKYGLAVDNLLDARIVDVNGRILDRKAMGEDLFWAISGGGGASFGVVLAYQIKLVPVPKTVTVFRVMDTIEQNATDLVYKFQTMAPTTDNDLFIRMLLQPVSSKIKKGTKTVRASFIAMFLGDSNRLLTIMNKDFPELGVKKSDCFEMNWIRSIMYWANFDNTTSIDKLLSRKYDSNYLKRKSDYIQTPIPKSSLELIWKKMIELNKPGFVFNPYGGRMNEISSSAKPFPHRAGNLFKIQYSVNWDDSAIESETQHLNEVRSLYSFMEPYVSKNPRGAFLNYRDVDIGVNTFGKNSYDEGKVYGEKYFMGNFDRLVKVKTAVDSGNFFRNEQSIPVIAGGGNGKKKLR